MDQPHGIVEAGRGRRLECHAADLDRDRPDLGDLTEGRGRIGGVEKALQEFNPRHATGDLRRHKPELAMRIWIVHVSLSLATGKAAVARQRGSRETVSGRIKLAGGLENVILRILGVSRSMLIVVGCVILRSVCW